MAKDIISYAHLTPEEADAKAVNDVRFWYGETKAEELFAMIAEMPPTDATACEVAISMDMTGCSGFPIHAVLRTYNKGAYDAWLTPAQRKAFNAGNKEHD